MLQVLRLLVGSAHAAHQRTTLAFVGEAHIARSTCVAGRGSVCDTLTWQEGFLKTAQTQKRFVSPLKLPLKSHNGERLAWRTGAGLGKIYGMW